MPMQKTKNQISPTKTKTLKSLFTKSSTLCSKIETSITLIKTKQIAWTQEMQALSAQLSLIEGSMHNPQTVLSPDFHKNFDGIIKKFSKIKETIDTEQTTLNKLTEAFSDEVTTHLTTCKKKATDLSLETELNKNIKQFNAQKTIYQDLINEVNKTIQALNKRLHDTEKFVNRLNILPHLAQLIKLAEKLGSNLELFSKETTCIDTTLPDDVRNPVQTQYKQLCTLFTKMTLSLEQSSNNIKNATPALAATGAKNSHDVKDQDTKDYKNENEKGKPALG